MVPARIVEILGVKFVDEKSVLMDLVLMQLLGKNCVIQLPELPHFLLVARRTNLNFRHFRSFKLEFRPNMLRIPRRKDGLLSVTFPFHPAQTPEKTPGAENPQQPDVPLFPEYSVHPNPSDFNCSPTKK